MGAAVYEYANNKKHATGKTSIRHNQLPEISEVMLWQFKDRNVSTTMKQPVCEIRLELGASVLAG